MKGPDMKEKESDRQDQRIGANPLLSRRRFFRTTGLAAAGLFAAGCGRSKNPLEATDILSATGQSVQSPSDDVIAAPLEALTRVATADIHSYDPRTLKAAIQSSIEAIGGPGDLIRPGDTVGFKINMTGGASYATRSTTDYGVSAVELYWTHPEVLRAVMELCRDAGAGRLIVVEANYDTPSYTQWGYRDVVDALGAEYHNLNDAHPYGNFREEPVPDPLTHWESYYLNGILYDLDCFISLPKTKRHLGGGITNAMKNSIGLVPLSKYQKSGGWREKLHCDDNLEATNSYAGFKNLVRTIVDLCKIRPIHLSVCDAVLTSDFGEGPWIRGFEPVSFNTLITSKDPVAADAIATTLFGYDPTAADRGGAFASSSMKTDFAGTDNYLRIAAEQGLGVYDPARIEVIDATVSTRVAVRG